MSMAFLLHLAALFTCDIMLGKVTGNTIQLATYDNTGQDNRLFDESLVFDLNNNSRSILDCARACLKHDSCEVFTVVPTASKFKFCRGHSGNLALNSNYQSVSGSRTYRLGVDSDSGDAVLDDTTASCAPGAHDVIDDPWRDVNLTTSGSVKYCDKSSLVTGWYRFLLNGATAHMPTQCPPGYHCGTDASMWLDLMGATLPEVGQEVTGRACSSFLGDCCYSNWHTTATVRNCGSFYVYHLVPPIHCSLAYCAELS